MFDISFPAMVKGGMGNSVICANGKHESCQIFIPNGFECLDLVRRWLAEASAVSQGRRRRGVLPTQIGRNRDGRFGCVAGWVMVRDKKGVHLYDCANCHFEGRVQARMFENSPENWWRCIRAGTRKGDGGVFVISPSSLGAWAERLVTLLHAIDATVDLLDYKQSVKNRNAELVSADLRGMPGGADLFAVFPSDFVDRMLFVMNSKHSADGIADDVFAGDSEFDMGSYPKRSKETLIRWIKREFRRNNSVVFLVPQDQKGVTVVSLKQDEDIGAKLSVAIKVAQIKNKTLDCVLFSTKSILPKLMLKSGPTHLTQEEFRQLLMGGESVLMGVSQGESWVELPIGSVFHIA